MVNVLATLVESILFQDIIKTIRDSNSPSIILPTRSFGFALVGIHAPIKSATEALDWKSPMELHECRNTWRFDPGGRVTYAGQSHVGAQIWAHLSFYVEVQLSVPLQLTIWNYGYHGKQNTPSETGSCVLRCRRQWKKPGPTCAQWQASEWFKLLKKNSCLIKISLSTVLQLFGEIYRTAQRNKSTQLAAFVPSTPKTPRKGQYVCPNHWRKTLFSGKAIIRLFGTYKGHILPLKAVT